MTALSFSTDELPADPLPPSPAESWYEPEFANTLRGSKAAAVLNKFIEEMRETLASYVDVTEGEGRNREFDMNGYRITDLADPEFSTDMLNLRTLRELYDV